MSRREPHPEGVYFDLPFDEYLDDPSLGSGDVKRLTESPETYWYGSPLNPDYEPKDKDHFRRGRAFHKLILEGRDAFFEDYTIAPVRADYPDAIDTTDELKRVCEEYGLPNSGNKAALIERIRDTAWPGQIWTEIMAEFAERAGGKEHFKADEFAALDRVDKIIRANPDYARAFEDGYPEVSIFLTDKATGAPLRMRADWLADGWFVDLKTFSNSMGKKVNKAITDATVNYHYHVKIAMYQSIIEQAKTFDDDKFHGCPPEFIAKFKDGPEHQGVLMFVGTDVPHVRARGLTRLTPPTQGGQRTERLIWQTGHSLFRDALRTYEECMERFGRETPWNVVEPIVHFEDLAFPAYAMEQ